MVAQANQKEQAKILQMQKKKKNNDSSTLYINYVRMH